MSELIYIDFPSANVEILDQDFVCNLQIIDTSIEKDIEYKDKISRITSELNCG